MARVTAWNESDLAAIYNDPSGPAIDSVYTQFGNDSVHVPVIYDNPGDDLDGPGKSRMIRQKPKISVMSSAVVGISNKDTFVIETITYYVTQFHADGWGRTLIDLSLSAT